VAPTTEAAALPTPIRAVAWLFAGVMLLYPIHEVIVVLAGHESAGQLPPSQFDLRTMAIHDTVFGWAGAWGCALGVVWLAVASALWIYYVLNGRHLTRTSLKPFIAVVMGLLIVTSMLALEMILTLA
jgi:hypothetical protein